MRSEACHCTQCSLSSGCSCHPVLVVDLVAMVLATAVAAPELVAEPALEDQVEVGL